MLSRYANWLALFSLLALIASLAVWHLQPPAWSLTGVLLLCAPLLLPLPGMWRGNAYTHAWASLLVLFYMVYVLTELVGSPDGRSRATTWPPFFATHSV